MSTDRRMAEARRLYRLIRRADGVAAVSILAAAMVDAHEEGREDGRREGAAGGVDGLRSTVEQMAMRLRALEMSVFGNEKGRV